MRTTDLSGDVVRAGDSAATGPLPQEKLAMFFCGVACTSALTAGIALLLYTGAGFLRTAGVLLGVAVAAVAAGLWAGDERSSSSRGRIVLYVFALVVACVFAAKWTGSETLRARPYGGSLAVLFVLALPAYAAGGALASLWRHSAARGAGAGLGTGAGAGLGAGGAMAVRVLAGCAVGFILTTAVMIPRIDAWGVFFAAAMFIMPSALFPISRNEDSMTDVQGTMTGRVVVITGVGAAGQLGFAVASKFFAAGARVVVAGHSDAVRGLADQLGPRDRVLGVRADLTTSDGVAAVAAAAASLGRLDVLINVAGGLTVIDSVENTTGDKFRHEMAINAETVLLMSRAALPMLRQSRGAIVNFTSPAGENALASMGAYSAAKAAVIALTQSLALEEAANGVRVNAIAPGMIDTDQNRFSAGAGTKFVTREQVADVVMFLVSEAGSGISGEVVRVVNAAVVAPA